MEVRKALTAAMLIAAAALLLPLAPDPRWVIVMSSAAIAYGVLSPLIAARKLYFLAGASPHAALLAAVLAIPLSRTTAVSEYLWALLLGTLLIYVVGYMINRGVDPDAATAAFVAFTASSSVMALYFVLTNFPMETDIWAYIVGDPLLVSWSDAYYAAGIAMAVLLAALLTRREQVCIGVDRDYARLTGINVDLYDLLIFTLIAVTTIGLIRIVGFVLEHVLILLPAAFATSVAGSSREAIYLSVGASLVASLLGLGLAMATNTAPAGATGLILFTAYMVGLLSRRLRG